MHPTTEKVHITLVDWNDAAGVLTALRTEVFVVEQRVPAELELDGRDADCIHVAAFAGDDLVGTGRLLPDARIGRMAVASTWRNRGIGGRMLAALVEAARRRGEVEVRLAAQHAAVDFYGRHGFTPVGPEFIEAGIVHQHMVRRLDEEDSPARDDPATT